MLDEILLLFLSPVTCHSAWSCETMWYLLVRSSWSHPTATWSTPVKEDLIWWWYVNLALFSTFQVMTFIGPFALVEVSVDKLYIITPPYSVYLQYRLPNKCLLPCDVVNYVYFIVNGCSNHLLRIGECWQRNQSVLMKAKLWPLLSARDTRFCGFATLFLM